MTSSIKCIGSLSLTNLELLNGCGCIHKARVCVCVNRRLTWGSGVGETLCVAANGTVQTFGKEAIC